MATGNYQIETYSTINFRMRVTEGKLDYSNLVLALRGDDAFNVYEISLDKALNDDGDALPELGNEFVDVCISPNYSIEDADTKYTLKGTSDPSDVNVLSKILGFHLYAKGECSAVLEIEEVSISLAGEKPFSMTLIEPMSIKPTKHVGGEVLKVSLLQKVLI